MHASMRRCMRSSMPDFEHLPCVCCKPWEAFDPISVWCGHESASLGAGVAPAEHACPSSARKVCLHAQATSKLSIGKSIASPSKNSHVAVRSSKVCLIFACCPIRASLASEIPFTGSASKRENAPLSSFSSASRRTQVPVLRVWKDVVRSAPGSSAITMVTAIASVRRLPILMISSF